MKKCGYISIAVLLLSLGGLAILSGPVLTLSRYPIEPFPNFPGCDVRSGPTSADVLPKTVAPVATGVLFIFAGAYVLQLSRRGAA
jgi:hypothetical protein